MQGNPIHGISDINKCFNIYEYFEIFAIFDILKSFISIENVRKTIINLVIPAFFLLLQSCANQQPPGGGDEDKTPPKVSIISPKPGSVNFRGNSLVFEFDEYIDRRSFQDAFRMSPQVKGDIEFSWGAKDVEVRFPKDLEKIDANKTFVVNISTALKDIRGNSTGEAVNFAFSTGSRIDMGGVKGKVYNNDKKITSVYVYDMNKSYDPTLNIPDYFTESSAEGDYTLTNMSPGKYRIISIIDEDRNLLFTSERESFGVLPYDVDVKDSVTLQNVNFYMKLVASAQTTAPELDVAKYFKDSLGIVSASIEYNSSVVLPDQSIFIYFARNKPTREEFTQNLKVTDENGTAERMVFNWKNDSLVEIFSQNHFASNRKYSINFPFKTENDSIYRFSLPFRTVSVNSFGEMKGSVSTTYPEIVIPEQIVKIELEARALVPMLKYSFDSRDTVFAYKNILEANYDLFSYIDKNNNSGYDFGYPFPFEYSEPFYIYPGTINIKGGWVVENVNISFVR